MKEDVIKALQERLRLFEEAKIQRIHEIWRIEAAIEKEHERLRKLTGGMTLRQMKDEQLQKFLEESGK